MAKSTQEMLLIHQQRQQKLKEEQEAHNRVFWRNKISNDWTMFLVYLFIWKKTTARSTNPDAFKEVSDFDTSRVSSVQPKPRRRKKSSSQKTPFDDDSSVQFDSNDTRSVSSTTTGSTTPRERKMFIKTNKATPTVNEKLSVDRSPRDLAKTSISNRPGSAKVFTAAETLRSSTKFIKRAMERDKRRKKGIEIHSGQSDLSDEDSNSNSTSNDTSKRLFGSNKKSFIKKKVNEDSPGNVPELQHLDSETNNSDRESHRKRKSRPSNGPSSCFHAFFLFRTKRKENVLFLFQWSKVMTIRWPTV